MTDFDMMASCAAFVGSLSCMFCFGFTDPVFGFFFPMRLWLRGRFITVGGMLGVRAWHWFWLSGRPDYDGPLNWLGVISWVIVADFFVALAWALFVARRPAADWDLLREFALHRLAGYVRRDREP